VGWDCVGVVVVADDDDCGRNVSGKAVVPGCGVVELEEMREESDEDPAEGRCSVCMKEEFIISVLELLELQFERAAIKS